MKIWSVNDSERVQQRAIRWLNRHGVDHTNVYLVEFLGEEGEHGVARVHAYALNESGHKYTVEGRNGYREVAKAPPLRIPLSPGEYDRIETGDR